MLLTQLECINATSSGESSYLLKYLCPQILDFTKPRYSTTELACFHGKPSLPAVPTQSSNLGMNFDSRIILLLHI